MQLADNRQVDRQTDRQTNRQTDRQTDRQIDRQIDRQVAHLNISRVMMVSTSPRSETPIAMMDIKSKENVTRGLTTSTWGRTSCRTVIHS